MIKWIGAPSAVIMLGVGSMTLFAPAEAQDSTAFAVAGHATEAPVKASAGATTAPVDGFALAFDGKTSAGPRSSAAAFASTMPIPAGAGASANSTPGQNTDAAKALGGDAKAAVTLPAARLAAKDAQMQRAVGGSAHGDARMVFTAGKDSFVIKRILPIQGPIKYGEWYWDDEGVPDGPIVMTVDLDARVLSVFKGGYEIGATAALLGTTDHPTPLGTFPILTKERHNVSEKYDNAPMPWTLRLTWDGIAIHGGGEVENGYASHGCIGVPDGFASKLFDIAKKGDKVIITRGKSIGMGDKII